MNITKADIENRVMELKLERERMVAQTVGTYDGAIQELERLLSSFNSKESTSEILGETKEK